MQYWVGTAFSLLREGKLLCSVVASSCPHAGNLRDDLSASFTNSVACAFCDFRMTTAHVRQLSLLLLSQSLTLRYMSGFKELGFLPEQSLSIFEAFLCFVHLGISSLDDRANFWRWSDNVGQGGHG